MTVKVYFNCIEEFGELKEKIKEKLKNTKLPIFPETLISTSRFLTFVCDDRPKFSTNFHSSITLFTRLNIENKDLFLITFFLLGNADYEILIFAISFDDFKEIVQSSFEKNKKLNLLLADIYVPFNEVITSKSDFESLLSLKFKELNDYLNEINEISTGLFSLIKKHVGGI